jgi:hypothetical protein
MGLVESAFGGSMESGVGWSVLCWCFWNKYGLNHGEEVFTFNVVGKIFYKFFALLMQFANNVTTNFVSVQHRKGSVPLTLTDHMIG